MISSELPPRLVVFVVVSLITHLLELAASGLFCHVLIEQGDLKTPWFSVSAGLLIIPLVSIQLVSALMLLRHSGEAATTYQVTATAILHVLQLGFISRHFTILKEAPLSAKRTEVIELLILRLSLGLTSGCTLLLVHVYLLLQDAHKAIWLWAVYASGITIFISVSWAISSFRRYVPDVDFDRLLVTCPGTILRLLWRAGEILTRVIALSLFSSLYTHWLFPVLGLHWLTMLVCVSIPVMTSLEWRATSYGKRALFCVVTSFSHIFAFINTSSENAILRYAFYYVVLFLENAVLIAVWIIQSSSEIFARNCGFVYTAAASSVLSILSMIFYHKFFPATKTTPGGSFGSPSSVTRVSGEASNNHSIPPRPEPGGNRLSPYPPEATSDQHCKPNIQDTLLHTFTERSFATTLDSSPSPLQKLADVDDDIREIGICHKQQEKNSSTSNADGKLKHKDRGKKQKNGKGFKTEKGLARIADQQLQDKGSPKKPVWLPSSDSNITNQLLTYSLQTFDTDDHENPATDAKCHYHDHTGNNSPSLVSIHQHCLHTASCQELTYQKSKDHGCCSDDPSTDKALDWSKLLLAPDIKHVHSVSDGEDSGNSTAVKSLVTLHHRKTNISHSQSPGFQCHQHDISPKRHRHFLPGEKVSLDVLNEFTCHSNRSTPHLDSSKVQMSEVKQSGKDKTLPDSKSHISLKVKRKHVPTPRLHHCHFKSASHSNSDEQMGIHQELPHNHMMRSDGKIIDHMLACSEKLAAELLKSQTSTEQQRSKDIYYYSSSSTSDHRLSVRVMTPADDDMKPKTSDASGGNCILSNPANLGKKTSHKSRQTFQQESQIFNEEIDQKDSVITPPIDINSSKGGINPIEPHTSDSSLADKDEYFENQNNALTSATVNQQDAVIYENIWYMNKTNQFKEDDTNEFIPATGINGQNKCITSSTRDVWYICSESEDSALPPEAISSSVDGFTDPESDFSMEFVI